MAILFLLVIPGPSFRDFFASLLRERGEMERVAFVVDGKPYLLWVVAFRGDMPESDLGACVSVKS